MHPKKLFFQIMHFAKGIWQWHIFNKELNMVLTKVKTQPLSSKYKSEIKKRYSDAGFKITNTKWHRYFSNIHGVQSTDYIPDLFFFRHVEPALNRIKSHAGAEDKNLLDKFIPQENLPDTVVKNSNGFFYNADGWITRDQAIKECMLMNEFVVKPTCGTSSGVGVKKITLSEHEDKSAKIESLFTDYKHDFIIQKILTQCEEFAELNKSSINTIRIISYMNSEGVIPLSAVMRIGKEGHFADNMSLGGTAWGIDDNGKIKSYGIDEFGNRLTEFKNGKSLEGYQIPCFEEAIELVKKVHKNIPYFRILSWDLAVTKEKEVKVIEFNALFQGIDLHQLLNGPLFREYTDEVFEIVKNHNPIED